MQHPETMKIEDGGDSFIVINKDDFDSKNHVKFSEEPKAAKPKVVKPKSAKPKE